MKTIQAECDKCSKQVKVIEFQVKDGRCIRLCVDCLVDVYVELVAPRSRESKTEGVCTRTS